MLGLDSIRLLLLLLYTMYLDISKVYGGVRLKPVHSAISLYAMYFYSWLWILDKHVLPMAGRLATESDISPFIVLF